MQFDCSYRGLVLLPVMAAILENRPSAMEDATLEHHRVICGSSGRVCPGPEHVRRALCFALQPARSGRLCPGPVLWPYDELSRKIMDQTLAFSNNLDAALTIVPAGSIVPAACFMRITQEAKLKILELSNMTAAGHVFSVKVWQMIFEFGNRVRRVVLEVDTTLNTLMKCLRFPKISGNVY